MTKKEKTKGTQFCDDLYDVLVYATKNLLNDPENKFEEEFYDYTDLFEHFEEVADKFIALKRLIDAYNELSSDLVGFAITQDINDFEMESSLTTNELLELEKKIQEQIKRNKELYGEV